jgi:hypothetical protein
MIVDKVFCKSMMVFLPNTLRVGKANPYPECVFQLGQNTTSSMMEVAQCTQLVPLGNGAILGAKCWSLLLTDWALSSIQSQDSHGKWKPMFLGPQITSIPGNMATLFMSPLDNNKERCQLVSPE